MLDVVILLVMSLMGQEDGSAVYNGAVWEAIELIIDSGVFVWRIDYLSHHFMENVRLGLCHIHIDFSTKFTVISKQNKEREGKSSIIFSNIKFDNGVNIGLALVNLQIPTKRDGDRSFIKYNIDLALLKSNVKLFEN